MKRLDVAAVEAALVGTRFAGKLLYFPSVGSTNTLAIAAAQAGGREGVWVADEQTAGRGRGGHAWHSSAGDGLYVSALVFPQIPAGRAMWISLATGLAARSAISDACGLSVDIRWPNDLLVGGRKCGGILVESSLPAAQGEAAGGLRYAVIGVGINMNHKSFPEELAEIATSLRIESGIEPARERLLIALLRGLDAELSMLDAELGLHGEPRGAPEGAGLLKRFAEASTWVSGKRVKVGEPGDYTGLTAGLNPDGFLLVDADDGRQRIVLSGGVREL
ncbi:MAG: biotin--[acetyl-CoA-carboxylase] ligase [Acidobacteriaceae bacterium]